MANPFSSHSMLSKDARACCFHPLTHPSSPTRKLSPSPPHERRLAPPKEARLPSVHMRAALPVHDPDDPGPACSAACFSPAAAPLARLLLACTCEAVIEHCFPLTSRPPLRRRTPSLSPQRCDRAFSLLRVHRHPAVLRLRPILKPLPQRSLPRTASYATAYY
eukprot:385067-Prymnesium_polylepis.1